MNTGAKPIVVDHTVFLGMHNAVEQRRIASKALFTRGTPVIMTHEQVGLCDNRIWQLGREEQDVYYPFMDQLHSTSSIDRVGYTAEDVRAASALIEKEDFEASEALLVAFLERLEGTLYTWNERILAKTARARHPADAKETFFPERLEVAYRNSLVVRLE